MKCERCERNETKLLPAYCSDSLHPLTHLCLSCWADLQIWLKLPPAKLIETLLEGHDGEVDFVRPMGVV